MQIQLLHSLQFSFFSSRRCGVRLQVVSSLIRELMPDSFSCSTDRLAPKLHFLLSYFWCSFHRCLVPVHVDPVSLSWQRQEHVINCSSSNHSLSLVLWYSTNPFVLSHPQKVHPVKSPCLDIHLLPSPETARQTAAASFYYWPPTAGETEKNTACMLHHPLSLDSLLTFKVFQNTKHDYNLHKSRWKICTEFLPKC